MVDMTGQFHHLTRRRHNRLRNLWNLLWTISWIEIDHSFGPINQHWLTHSSFNWFIKSKATGDCLIVMNLQAALEIGNFTDCDATLLTQSSSCQQVRQRRDNADLALKMMVAMLREFTSPQYSGCHSQSCPADPVSCPWRALVAAWRIVSPADKSGQEIHRQQEGQ